MVQRSGGWAVLVGGLAGSTLDILFAISFAAYNGDPRNALAAVCRERRPKAYHIRAPSNADLYVANPGAPRRLLNSLGGTMPIANVLAMALGFVIAAIGVLGIAAPSILLEFGRSMQSTGALYFLAAVRIGFGAILLWAAANSRTPVTLRILGILIIIAGLVTPFLGTERSHGMLQWLSAQGPFFTRAWPIMAIGFGLFIAYATSPGHSAN
jgi:hypothetical protein